MKSGLDLTQLNMKAAAVGLHGAEAHSPALVLADALDQRQPKAQAVTASHLPAFGISLRHLAALGNMLRMKT